MSAEKLLKFPSNQADEWSAAGTRLVDVDIPAGIGYSNLDGAYLLLKTRIDTNETTVPNAVRPVSIGVNLDTPEYDSDCFIRNAYMESERAGRFDEIPEVNLLNQALDFYSLSSEDRKTKTTYNGSFLQDEYNFLRSNFRDLPKMTISGDILDTTDNPAYELTPELIVPLKKLIPFAANNTTYSNAFHGNTRVHLEFQDTDKTLVYAYQYTTNFECAPVDCSSVDPRDTLVLRNLFHEPQAVPLYIQMPVTVNYTSYDASGEILTIAYDTNPNDITVNTAGTYTVSGTDLNGGSGTGAEFVITVADVSYTDNQRITTAIQSGGSNYTHEDVITVSGNHFGGIGADQLRIYVQTVSATHTSDTVNTYITGLEHNANGVPGQVEVTIADALPVDASVTSYGNVNFEMSAPDADPVWYIEEVALVVPQLLLNKAQRDAANEAVKSGAQMSWMTWVREPQQMLQGTKFEKQFELPPFTGNVLTLTPKDTLVSEKDNAARFRYRINGADATRFDVEPESTLYHDQIVETWRNLRRPLNNLDETGSQENSYAEKPVIYPRPIPLAPEQGRATLTINSNSNMAQKNVYMYKQVRRTLTMNADGATIN